MLSKATPSMAATALPGATDARRITVLDGWRGISILLVIGGHWVDYRWGSAPQSPLYAIGDVLSIVGVCIFFVISGLIITTLALREKARTGSISATDFYIRRALRIVPPFYLYLICIAALSQLGLIAQRHGQTLEAAALMCNLPASDCGWFAGHAWSLAYEEQFYVLFPLLFIMLGSRMRDLIGALFIVLLAVPLVRYALDLGPPWFVITHATFTISFVCGGALLAIFGEQMARLCTGPRATRISGVALLLLTAAISLEVAKELHPHAGRLARLLMLLRPTIEPACVAWLIAASIHNTGFVRRLLNSAPLQFIGLISYSLYLWQQLFTGPASSYPHPAVSAVPLLMFVFAALSYRYVERPCAKFAKRVISKWEAARSLEASAASSSV